MGGAERVLSILSTEWTNEHSVKVVALDGRKREFRYGGEVVDLALGAPRGSAGKVRVVCGGVWSLVRLFNRESVDRIVCFMEPANFVGAVAVLLTGMREKLVVSVHHDPLVLSRIRRLLIPLLYRIPPRVIAVSRGVAEALSSCGVPRSRIRTVYNPVSLPSRRRSVRRPYGSRYILGVGRLHPDKGFDRLLRAFALLDDRSLHLVILGEGSERESLTRLAEQLGLASAVILKGSVKDVDSWYQHAECLVLTSRTEAWALVLVEAMANGCPVVSFNCNFGPAEVIEDGWNGVLVRDGDILSLVAAVKSVAQNHNLRTLLSENGRKSAARFDVRSIAKNWLS